MHGSSGRRVTQVANLLEHPASDTSKYPDARQEVWRTPVEENCRARKVSSLYPSVQNSITSIK